MISAASRLDRLVLWVGLLLLLTGSPASASTNDAWFTRVWKTDDGLINNNILAMVQGPDGYLWVAPSVGLMRFDGVHFSRFPLENFTGPIDNHILTVLRGQKGVLWIATYGGSVIGLKPDFSVVRLPKTSLPAGAPLTLAEDKAGSLWLGYATVICRVKDGQVTRFGANEGVPSGGFRSLTSDGAGNMWLAQGNQVCFFRDGRFQLAARAPGVQCLAATPTNAVWFVAGTHLFSCDTEGSRRDYGSCQGLRTASRRALLEDRTGAVWIGTYSDGLFRYGKSGFEPVETSSPLIVSLAEDKEGNLWVGTAGGGLDRISLSGVRLEASHPVSDPILCLCEDTNGAVWGASRNGLLVSRINGEWMPVFTNAPFSGTVRCVATDRHGGIWIGTGNGKVLRLDDNHYAPLDQTNGAVLHTVFALLPAATDSLWVVGGQHIQYWHEGQLQDIQLPRSVGQFSAITEDATGDIWVGAKGIVMRSKGDHFVDESPRLPIAGRTICCLYGTPDGSLWISCGGLGLLRFKNGRVGKVGVAQGLFNDYISQIVADGQGWLWFASDHGIFKIRQRELEQAMEDRNVKLHPIVYGRNEGLSSLEALFSTTGSPFVLPRALRTRDGRVWMLTHTGVVVVNPKLLPDHYPAPPVLLTRVAMDGHTIATYGDVAQAQTVANLKTLNAPLYLPPGHRHLEFDYTAFHFRAPGNIRFRYQLAGFDNGWIYAGGRRSADYSRLTAGNYQFRVDACIGDGPWSETPAALAFTVAPFFWQTWWFRLGALLLFTLSVIALVRYISFRRMRQKLRAVAQQAVIERERGRIARDIHDDLGERLTEIQLLTGIAQHDTAQPDKAIAHVRQIASAARQATDALDEIVWAVNPRNDTLPHLIDYLGQFTVEFLRTAGIRCRTDLPEHPPVKPVAAEVRHALFLATKESLNNIVRHAGATEVSLLILVTDESIRVILEDNGRGFNGEAQNHGADGLDNMRRRMVEIGGQFQIQSEPGAGTRVSFNGPWLVKKELPN